MPNSSPIYDSSVIVQYLDSLAPADRKVIPPPSDPKRYEALTIESLGDGILDAAILVRYETVLRVTPPSRSLMLHSMFLIHSVFRKKNK